MFHHLHDEKRHIKSQGSINADNLHKLLKNWRSDTGAIVPEALNPKFDEKAEAKAIHTARLKLRPKE